jgi:hypothetical protein
MAVLIRSCLVIPPEPPVVVPCRRNGAQRARARLPLARRSVPLPASTVLAPFPLFDGRIRWDYEALVHPAGELRAAPGRLEAGEWLLSSQGRIGIPKGKETVGFVPLGPPENHSCRWRQFPSLLFQVFS